ncbi:MAG: NRDE family protein [Phycisphaerae bacterium]|nr:NRDE family protein [Phycisphaerae bacterium]
MCTVSIISIRASDGRRGFRAVCNRDENRGRAAARAPEWRAVPGGEHPPRAIYPVDPSGGGTWIAASSRGLLLCLLNLNESPAAMLPPASALRSRGLVIPDLIASTDSGEVGLALREMDLDAFAPFRLVVADGCGARGVRMLEARWDRDELRIAEVVRAPACFVSSGLGDALAAPRLELFERHARELEGAGGAEAQDRFHAHQWADRPEISVRMSRADARTMSVTTVTVLGSEVAMGYRALAAEEAAEPSWDRARRPR